MLVNLNKIVVVKIDLIKFFIFVNFICFKDCWRVIFFLRWNLWLSNNKRIVVVVI